MHIEERVDEGGPGWGVIALLVAGAAGCSSDSKKSAATVGAAESAQQAGAATAAPATTAAAADAVALTGTGAATAASTGGVTFGSALAITAAVTVQVADVRAAVNELPAIVTKRGAAIFDSTIAIGDPTTATATVTVKVRPQDLEDLIAGLGGLGELTARSQQTEDVTDQLADTESRIATAQKSVDRVRALLDTATDLDAVVRIEGELTIRETALEQLLATQRNVTDRVQLATLTVTFTPAPPVARVAHGTRGTSVGGALRSGWHGFVVAAHGVAVGVAYLAPVIALALLVALVLLALRAIRRRRHRPDVVTG